MDEKIAAGRKDWESRFLKKPPEKIESTSGMDINIDCVRAYCTLGETCDVLRGVFGEYKPVVTV
jgi:methylmalonyl-CoA mutase N-terminal domain/subunit